MATDHYPHYRDITTVDHVDGVNRMQRQGYRLLTVYVDRKVDYMRNVSDGTETPYIKEAAIFVLGKPAD